MTEFYIARKKESYDFVLDKNKVMDFSNNWKNNSLDIIKLFNNGVKIFEASCQTVANYCFGDKPTDKGDFIVWGDTIRPGKFFIRLFVEPRNFHGQPHAIINAIDIEGQPIDNSAMQETKDGYQNGRWLIHDRYSFKTGKDTNYAWSKGCFILSSADLDRLNQTLKNIGCKSGDVIEATLIEV